MLLPQFFLLIVAVNPHPGHHQSMCQSFQRVLKKKSRQEELVAPIIHNKEFTELKADYAKLQEQLQCAIQETNLLRQSLEKREQELGVLKHVVVQEKVLLGELGHRNEILQQQQQYANEEIEKLNKGSSYRLGRPGLRNRGKPIVSS